jgi:hypothetical protein
MQPDLVPGCNAGIVLRRASLKWSRRREIDLGYFPISKGLPHDASAIEQALPLRPKINIKIPKSLAWPFAIAKTLASAQTSFG